ncbi:hypothetical protein [Lysobacter sp. D1-1-M9]|uniref:restriction endonuclease subunit S n=1 Tax=Novilysobacter longmucuonensis TaxID=3098603 RepID=UPI002FC62B77
MPNEEIERYRLSEGDVLLTEGGDWDKLGRAAIWRSEIALCLHQNHVFRVRSLRPELLLPEWIEMFANGPIGISYFQNAAKQTTNLASINMTQLRGCPLPIPAPAEQRRIVAKVHELMAICGQLEASLVLTQADQARLLDSLLHEALAPERALKSDPAMRTAA